MPRKWRPLVSFTAEGTIPPWGWTSVSMVFTVVLLYDGGGSHCVFRISRRRKIRPGGDTGGTDKAALRAREQGSQVQPVDVVRHQGNRVEGSSFAVQPIFFQENIVGLGVVTRDSNSSMWETEAGGL